MAINRQDYQYIRNTLPTNKNKMSDGSLGIGVQVQNLIVELNQDNVFNQYYPEFYGTKKTLSNSWGIVSGSVEMNYAYTTIPVSYNEEDDSFYVEKDRLEVSSTRTKLTAKKSTTSSVKNGGVILQKDNFGNVIILDTYSHRFTFDFSSYPSNIPEPTLSTGWMFLKNFEKRWSNNILTVTGTSSKSSITLTATAHYGYEYQITIQGPMSAFSNKLSDNSTIGLLTAGRGWSVVKEGSKFITSYTAQTNYGVNPKVHNISLSFSYGIPTYTPTTNLGRLQHRVKLEPNTSYVLQVVDSVSMFNTVKNFIQTVQSTEEGETIVDLFEGDQYLFFQTPNDNNTDYALSIKEIGFGYQIFGVLKDSVVDLRRYKAPTQAKVFLFKSDLPWIVNKQGVIVGLKDTQRITNGTLEDECVAIEWSQDDVKKLFQSSPQVTIGDSSSLKILFPDTLSTTTQWKYAPLWEYRPTPLMNDICLVACRDYLTETTRVWNGKEVLVRRGVVRTIQRTKTSSTDHYSNAEEEISTFKIPIQQRLLADYYQYNEDTGLPAPHLTLAAKTQTVSKNLTWNRAPVFDLSLLSLLGYNNKYCADNSLTGELIQGGYKYTTVCFAWGYYERDDEGKRTNQISLLSSYSDPIFIDRQLVHITESEDATSYELTVNDYIVEKTDTLEWYYPEKKEVICIHPNISTTEYSE